MAVSKFITVRVPSVHVTVEVAIPGMLADGVKHGEELVIVYVLVTSLVGRGYQVS